MRAIALVILLCMSSEVASAQTTEQCQPTQSAGDHLACYNRTAPPPHTLSKRASKAPITLDKPAASKTPIDQKDQYVDVLEVENSRLDARLKTICRRC